MPCYSLSCGNRHIDSLDFKPKKNKECKKTREIEIGGGDLLNNADFLLLFSLFFAPQNCY